MKNNKRYLFYSQYFFIIVIISLIFSAAALAVSPNQILYSLEVVDIRSQNLGKINLDRLQYYFEDSNQQSNLIYRDQLLELLGDNFEIVLDTARETEKEELIMEPKILVAPGKRAVMYVAQEELFLDLESVDSITYTNVFELELYPRNSFREEDSVLTEINLKTGQGPTGLETEIWIRENTPYLLGVMENSSSEKTKELMGKTEVVEKRYFALYLSAKPTGILSLPDLTSSLSGLEKIFAETKIEKNEGRINLKTVSTENADQDYDFSLAGFYQKQLKWRADFTINEILTKRHLVAVTGHLHDDLWMGMELIVLQENEVEIALKLKDRVFIGPFNFSAGINPLSYNFENGSDSLDWNLRGEASIAKNLKLAIEYKSLAQSDFAEADLSYSFNSYDLLMGYSQDLEIEAEKAYWLGLQFNF